MPKGNPNSFYAFSMRDFERKLIRDALLFANGNIKEAAKILGVKREMIRVKARDLGGIWDNDPPKEPYRWKYQVDKHDAKREVRNPTVGGSLVDTGRSSDEDERETDRADALEEELDHGADEPDADQFAQQES